MSSEIPIACLLTDAELQHRRKTVLQKNARFLANVTELENGFSYQFPKQDEALENLMTLINLERKCCPFLSFKLVVEADSELATLELTGPGGTKEMLQSLFQWN